MQRLLPLAFVILVSACSRETVNSVVSPSQVAPVSQTAGEPAALLARPSDTAPLIELATGTKKGHVGIAPDARTPDGEFHAQVTVNVHDLEPNATYQVWRAIDLVPNGTYDPNAPGVPFAETAVITTSSGGSGEAHFVRGGVFSAGDRFDLVIEVRLDDGVTVVLRSEALTITAK